ncbi:chromatin organization [Pleodorina starrii]|uniref:Chromatin organization n=1 Tax=Pleodorina starrii TaxID=330485 RepID=A0A9W6BBS4_9CHLO|nr:chromatin organization [Pleodorina starrii]GLC49254.1 chromatin organization [Pleodorina starrii]GLC73492.1 chromatin organization [Pleodorina starrii]
MASPASVPALLETLLGEDDSDGQDTALLPYIQALQRWKVWRDNVPLFYSSCVQCTNEWPSLTVQLFPHITPDPHTPDLQRHAVLYGNKQGDDDATVIVMASFAVFESGARQPLPSRLSDETAPVLDIATYAHPAGDVDRLRYCPSRPELLAAKCAGAALSLYDVGSVTLARPKSDRPAAAERAVEDAAGAAGAGMEVEEEGEEGGGGGGSLLCGGPVSTLKSAAQEDVSLAWGDSGGGGGLRLFSGVLGGGIGEYAVREDGSLAEVTVRRGGHDGDASVVDLAWGAAGAAAEPSGGAAADAAAAAAAGPGLLASCGTDGRTVLWDPRQRPPALQAPRCRQDVNGVGFSPVAGGSLLATAGNDGIVRVYDVRQLGGSAAGTSASTSSAAAAAAPQALHRLKGHCCAVRQVSFNPYGNGGGGGGPLLASADEQGRVLLWQLGRSEALEEGLATRPELLFAHAGHVLPVDDFSWSTVLYGTLASVAGFLDPEVVAAARAYPGAEPDLPQPPPAVQVWRPAADVLPPPPAAAVATHRSRARAAMSSSP